MEELERTFDFYKRESYDATRNLIKTRDSKFSRTPGSKQYDPWEKPAPDLRMQLYHPQPVPRNSRLAVQPWKYKASFDHDKVSKRCVTKYKFISSIGGISVQHMRYLMYIYYMR